MANDVTNIVRILHTMITQAAFNEQTFVGEMEFISEEEREWQVDTYQPEEIDHHHVFLCKRQFAHDMSHGTGIEGTGKLENTGYEQINPWLNLSRNERLHHRHRKMVRLQALVLASLQQINISPRTPHSDLPKVV